ncbi:hypothetical protein ACFPRL_10750 [Pseudoclavibacter helvolus]
MPPQHEPERDKREQQRQLDENRVAPRLAGAGVLDLHHGLSTSPLETELMYSAGNRSNAAVSDHS